MADAIRRASPSDSSAITSTSISHHADGSVPGKAYYLPS